MATTTDPLGILGTYSYTATGKEPTYTIPGSGGGSLVSFVYDKDDRLIAETDVEREHDDVSPSMASGIRPPSLMRITTQHHIHLIR